MVPPRLTDPRLGSLPGIRHGFFTRQGGVSGGIHATLNVGAGSDDAADAVAANRAKVAGALGVPPERLVSAHQIHSAVAHVATEPWTRDTAPKADAIVTDRPGLALGVLTADCVPILLADGDARVVAVAHAGWRGARDGVIDAVVTEMERLGAARSRIRAVIGPAIRQNSYEVGGEFPDHFPDAADFFRASERAGHFMFDLPGYVARRLTAAELGSVGDLGCDTASDPERFFSYRRATLRGEPDYGRMIAAIVLE